MKALLTMLLLTHSLVSHAGPMTGALRLMGVGRAADETLVSMARASSEGLFGSVKVASVKRTVNPHHLEEYVKYRYGLKLDFAVPTKSKNVLTVAHTVSEKDPKKTEFLTFIYFMESHISPYRTGVADLVLNSAKPKIAKFRTLLNEMLEGAGQEPVKEVVNLLTQNDAMTSGVAVTYQIPKAVLSKLGIDDLERFLDEVSYL